MALFRKRNPRILDLTEKYKRDQEKVEEIKTDVASSSDSSNAFGFLGNIASASNSNTNTENYPTLNEDTNEKKRQLSKKLLNLTEKIEDLSNQIYHLQQRIEVLERKSGVGRY